MDTVQKPVPLIPLFWCPVPLIVSSVYGHCSKVLVLDVPKGSVLRSICIVAKMSGAVSVESPCCAVHPFVIGAIRFCCTLFVPNATLI